MNRSVFKFPSPAESMAFDGERYTSGIDGPIQHEHYHRYLFALRYCVNKDVLDVASGEGYGSFLLGQAANSVIGVDIDRKAVDFANRNFMSERVSYRQGDAARLPIENQSIDVVVSFETIEHFARQIEFISEIDRVLKPDGVVIMSSPNREIYSEAQNYQNPFHVHEMNKDEFTHLLHTRFPYIHLLEQGAVEGSLILSLPRDEMGEVEGFTTRDGRLYERSSGVPGAPYFIAVAARTPIPAPPHSVLHADFFRQQIEGRLAAVEHLRQEQDRAHAQHVGQMSEIEASLRSGLADQAAQLEQAHARLEATQQRLQGQADAHARYARQMSEVESSLRASLAAYEQRIAEADQHVAVATQRAAEATQRAAEAAQQKETTAVQHAKQIVQLNDQWLRRLSASKNTSNISFWSELRGVARLLLKTKSRRLARHYRAVASSALFDAAWYLEQHSDVAAKKVDPPLHYLLFGEAEGRRPGPLFDARSYALANPDVPASGTNALLHFIKHGAREGRPLVFEGAPDQWRGQDQGFDAAFLRPLNVAPKTEERQGLPLVSRLSYPPLGDKRQPILVICHEASRTGAPILGWNLIKDLRKWHPVVTVLMRGGVLEEDFAAISDVVIGPLTYEEWQPSEIAVVAEQLVGVYRPLYAVANSVVTSPIVAPLGALGVPTVALIHEFAAYTRPLEWMRPTLDWATHIVFPAQIVAKSAFENFPGFELRRGVHILPQGRQALPRVKDQAVGQDRRDIGQIMRSANEADTFIVLGAGTVQMRKGVDLFLSVAAAARRLAPNVPFKFIWIGDGYDPEKDANYSVYLHEQINQSGLKDTVVFLDPVAEFEPAYGAADVFLLSSRLDPQPNVGIDAVRLGLPVVCFEGACGTAEVLASDPDTRELVLPHLDVEAAAREICRLANDPALLKSIGQAVARVGLQAYDETLYAARIDAWGREAAAAVSPIDLATLTGSGIIDPDMAAPPLAAIAMPASATPERIVLMQSTVVGLSQNQHYNAYFRRAVPGFHAQIYAAAHTDACGPGGANPTAHWIRQGRPQGPWTHQVFSPSHPPARSSTVIRLALHAHFYYPDLAGELARRLKANQAVCDLFISTDTEAKALTLERAFHDHRGLVTIRVMPNLGRDIGPLLTGFGDAVASGEYDVWGHVHGKKSAWAESPIGESYRTFLWDNLIGGKDKMMDLAVAAFAADPKLGLVFAEDPHLVGWDANRGNAEALLARMGISGQLPDFFEFPVGTMFWFRPSALRRLFDLRLAWDDYPREPLPYDGSLLHALERIVPFVAGADSFTFATLRAPGANW
jgi:glycosyltransferase involved in cell wall biosynthesis/SAM-dependent methyltransferase